MEDREVVEKVLQGQTQYFEMIVEKYQKLIYKIFYQSTYFKNSQDIEDMIQETFLSVFDKLHLYKSQYEFRNWLYTIALNKLRAFIKKEKVKNRVRKMLFLTHEEEDIRVKDEEIFHDKETHHYLMTAIQKLPVNYQKVLLLFYSDNLKLKDIAEILGTNENTIKTWLRRAKETLENNPEIKKIMKY